MLFSLDLGPTDTDISIFNSCRATQYSITLMYGNALSNSTLRVFKVVSAWLASKNNAAVNSLVYTPLGTSKSIFVG